MSNHPNRKQENVGIPPASPVSPQVREIREIAGHTQAEAAKLVHVTLTSWQRYETAAGIDSHRKMPAAAWHLYLRRCRDAGVKLPARYEKYLDEAIASVKQDTESDADKF